MSICKLTETAKSRINELCKTNSVYGVSLNLTGGGCAGFEYKWGFVETSNEIEPGDFVINTGAGNFVIGKQSLMFLAGTEVDYVTNIVGSTFEIKNPNAESSCGCGVSVNFNMEKLAYSAK